MAKKIESPQSSEKVAITELPHKRHLDHQDFYSYFALVQNSPFDVVVHFGYLDSRGEKRMEKGEKPSVIDRCTVRMPPIVALQLAEALNEHVKKHRKEFVGYDPVDLARQIEASRDEAKPAGGGADSSEGGE